MKVIGFSIFKGGTGKSTSAVHAAYALAQKGKTVLLIDLDWQVSATRYQAFMGTVQPGTAVQKTKFGVDMFTSTVMVAAIVPQGNLCFPLLHGSRFGCTMQLRGKGKHRRRGGQWRTIGSHY